MMNPSDVDADRMIARASDAKVVDLLAWKESAVLRERGSNVPALAPSVQTYGPISIFAVVVALLLLVFFLRAR